MTLCPRFGGRVVEPRLQKPGSVARIGGSPLDLHVSLAEAHEADPAEGKRYKYLYNTKLRANEIALKQILLIEEWDFVTIQQVSHKSYKPETYRPYAKQLVDYVRKYAPQARVVIHETWAHSIDSYRFKDWGLDPDDMYSRLHTAYADIAEELEIAVIPVGTAFERAKATPMWDYQPTTVDTALLTFPEDRDNLPDMSRSLHQVFYWHPDRKNGGYRLVNDGFHANANGKYLGALVWYRFFFEQDPCGVTFAPPELTTEQAVSLRKVAFEVIPATRSWISGSKVE